MNKPIRSVRWPVGAVKTGGHIILLVLACFLPSIAWADSCSVTASGIDYGSYSPVSNTAATASTNMTVTCQWTLNLAMLAKVCVNLGAANEGGGVLPRSLYASTGLGLNMNMYSDAALSVVWGGIAAGASTPVTVRLNAPLIITGRTSVPVPVYGQIPASQMGAALVGSTSTIYKASYSGANATYKWGFHLPALEPSCASLPHTGNFSFSATATVINQCVIRAAPLDFGVVGNLASPVDVATNLSLSCTSGSAYKVALNGGTTSGQIAGRKMSGAGHTVDYDLYLDSARSIRWGDGSTGSQIAGTGNGNTQSIAVYGRVAAQPTPVPGNYTDTITATITY